MTTPWAEAEAALTSRVDLGMLHPEFLVRLLHLLEQAYVEKGVALYVLSGHRSFEAQDALYAQGRSKPGNVVTRARAGQSAHNYGIAADVCVDANLDRPGLQPDWSHAAYALLGDMVGQHGLVWGGGWKFADRPHVQLPGFVTAAQLEPLRLAHETGGLESAWRLVDESLHGTRPGGAVDS